MFALDSRFLLLHFVLHVETSRYITYRVSSIWIGIIPYRAVTLKPDTDVASSEVLIVI